jgi:hypothetical protein
MAKSVYRWTVKHTSCNKAYNNFGGLASFQSVINIAVGQIIHVLPNGEKSQCLIYDDNSLFILYQLA